MNHFTLTSPHFHIVVLLLCFTCFSMSSIHSNPSTIPVIDVQEGSPYFFINDASYFDSIIEEQWRCLIKL